MKGISYISAIFIFLGIMAVSCEDVIDVEVPIDEPRLVIGGLLRVDTTQEFVGVKIKVTQTSGFFDEVLPISNVENMYILYGFEEFGDIVNPSFSNLSELEMGSGIYEPDPTFTTDQRIRTSAIEPGMAFFLIFDHEGRRYAGKTYYASSVAIDSLTQGDGILFDEEDTEVIVSFTDDPEVENYYLFDFGFGNFITSEDTFYEGQPFSFSYFYENVNPGDTLTVSLIGSDQTFYNYMNLLLDQTEGDFNVFETPAATVRGNIFDVTGIDNINQFDNVNYPDNYPLGYFSISETFTDILVVE